MNNIREEHQNPYAYQVMCFFDIASSDNNFSNYLEKNKMSGSEDIFWQIGEWIDEFNKSKWSTYDEDRYSLWQDFIGEKIND